MGKNITELLNGDYKAELQYQKHRKCNPPECEILNYTHTVTITKQSKWKNTEYLSHAVLVGVDFWNILFSKA